MKIPYVNIKKQYKHERKNLLKVIDRSLSSGKWIGGDEVENFENSISKICRTKYCVSLNSGTDMPVHLTGRMCSMDKIMKISKKYNIPVIEDCAQSILSKYKKKMSGSWGEVGCFSAHPLKNLNASGDGGYLTTNNEYIYKKIKNLRTHGMDDSRDNVSSFGYVSRMDNIQAAILNFRLKNLKNVINKRRQNVDLYLKNLNLNKVYFPKEKKFEFNTYHTFVIQVEKRDQLKAFLKKKGIETTIHYPMPIHLQSASRHLGYKKGDFIETEQQSKKILTLPINQYLTKKEILYICRLINKYYG